MKRIRGDLLKSLFYGKDPRNCHADAYATKAAQGVLISLYQRVQTYLGHRSLKSTQRYTHLSNTEVAKSMKNKLEELFREKLDDAGFEHKGIKSAKPAHILNGAGRV